MATKAVVAMAAGAEEVMVKEVEVRAVSVREAVARAVLRVVLRAVAEEGVAWAQEECLVAE